MKIRVQDKKERKTWKIEATRKHGKMSKKKTMINCPQRERTLYGNKNRKLFGGTGELKYDSRTKNLNRNLRK